MRLVLIRAFNTLLWLCFLALLVASTLVHQLYPAKYWGGIQTGLAVIIVASLSQRSIRSEFSAVLQKSGMALAILVVSVLWLSLQIYLPVNNAAFAYLFGNEGQAVWFTASSVWSLVPDKTTDLVHQELFMMTGFLTVLLMVNTRLRLYCLLGVITAVAVTHALMGILSQQAGVFLVPVSQLDGHFDAARGLFINRNHFAAFLVLCSVACLGFSLRLLVRDTSHTASQYLLTMVRSWQMLAPLILIVILAALALSQSRAGFVGFLIACMVCLQLFGGRTLQRRIVLPAVLFLAMIALWIFGADLLTRLAADVTLGERLQQWKLTWQIIMQQPLLGYGGNSYSDVFQLYRELEPFRYVTFNQAHNDLLHIWLEQGLVGLTLWLGFIGLVVNRSIRNLRLLKSRTQRCLSLAVLAVLIATLLQSLVDFHLHIVTIRLYFFCLCALVFVIPCLRSRHRAGVKNAKDSSPK